MYKQHNAKVFPFLYQELEADTTQRQSIRLQTHDSFGIPRYADPLNNLL